MPLGYPAYIFAYFIVQDMLLDQRLIDMAADDGWPPA